MGERSLKLQDSLYTKYYGAEYDSVKESLIQEYTRYNKELGHTFAQKMTGHEQLSDTLACTYYEDGTKVYVNYGYDEEKTEDGINVAARDYIVVRSGGRYEE